MYAVIKSGGKQYKVKEGDVVRVEKLTAAEGAAVDIKEVLLVADGDAVRVGTPRVADATVSATVKAHGRGRKLKVIKFRRRKHSRKQLGHRQAYTELGITGISVK